MSRHRGGRAGRARRRRHPVRTPLAVDRARPPRAPRRGLRGRDRGVRADRDENAVLDAVGGYTARRRPVRSALPDDAATDAGASGRAREVLREATRDYALVGDPETVGERVAAIKAAGADLVIGYPAGGVDAFREA